MPRFLLVDDSEAVRLTLAATLIDSGYEVTAVGTCHEARPVLAASAWDLLIADVKLPDCTGTSLADEAASRRIPHLLITGDFDTYEQLRLAGKNCLQKPFSLTDFVERVEARLRQP